MASLISAGVPSCLALDAWMWAHFTTLDMHLPLSAVSFVMDLYSYRKMLFLDWQAVAVVSTYRIQAEVFIIDKLFFLYGYRHFPSSFFLS
jgi:hypothetical protein